MGSNHLFPLVNGHVNLTVTSILLPIVVSSYLLGGNYNKITETSDVEH